MGFHSSTLTDVRREVRPQKREHKTHLHFSSPSQCQLPRWQRQKNKWNGWWMRAVKCCPHVSINPLWAAAAAGGRRVDGKTWYVSVCQLVMWKWNEKWRRTARNLRSSKSMATRPGEHSKSEGGKKEERWQTKGENMSCKFWKNAKNAIVENIFLFHFLSITSYLLANKFGACAVGWLVG